MDGIRKAHFIAIGGQGMSAVARILMDKGIEIEGSDVKESSTTERLAELGAKIHIGHSKENLDDPDVVVVSSAISEDNPELMEARRRGIPVVHRMDMLLKAVEGKKILAVAGAHGKTTTTAMCAWVLSKAGLDPVYLVGGDLIGQGNASPGNGDWAVFETDESDGSFLKVHADIGIATNIDNDHLDYWGDIENLTRGFHKFLDNSRYRVVCGDDPRLTSWAHGKEAVATYSVNGREAAVRAVDIEQVGWGICCLVTGKLGEFGLRLQVPGIHNLQDALAAITASVRVGLPVREAAAILGEFPGVKRRLERIGEFGGVLVLDDFGHHPKEIKASIRAIREALPGRRLNVLFQPHRYSRTRLLAGELGEALAGADSVVVTRIYAGPGEAPEPGVSADMITRAAQDSGLKDVVTKEEIAEAVEAVVSRCSTGDVLLTLGAGDVFKTHQKIAGLLSK